MDVNNNVLEFLKENRITINELAQHLSIASPNLLRMLKADDMKVSLLLRIADYLSVSPALLINGEETINKSEFIVLQEDNKNLKHQIKLIEINFKLIADLHFNIKKDVIKNDLSKSYQDDIIELLLKEAEEEKEKLSSIDDSTEIFKLTYSTDWMTVRKECIKRVKDILYDENDFIEISKEELDEITGANKPKKKIGLKDSTKGKKNKL